ncbi:unnamed protein product, partial [Brenthis ino]
MSRHKLQQDHQDLLPRYSMQAIRYSTRRVGAKAEAIQPDSLQHPSPVVCLSHDARKLAHVSVGLRFAEYTGWGYSQVLPCSLNLGPKRACCLPQVTIPTRVWLNPPGLLSPCLRLSLHTACAGVYPRLTYGVNAV